MRRFFTRRRWVLTACLVLAAVGVLVWLNRGPKATRRSGDKIKYGMTRREVEALLGGKPEVVELVGPGNVVTTSRKSLSLGSAFFH